MAAWPSFRRRPSGRFFLGFKLFYPGFYMRVGVRITNQVFQRKPRHNGQGHIHRNAPVVGGLAGGAAHLQGCQTFLTAPASAVLAEASRGVKIVALMALANFCDLPSLLFTLLLLSIATDFQVVAFPNLHAKMGYAIDPLEWVFAFCTAEISAAILCFSQPGAVQNKAQMLGQIWMQFSTQMLQTLRVGFIENGFHWTVHAA